MNRFINTLPLRMGFIVLSTDLTLERDLALLRPAADIDFFVTRTPFHNPITENSLTTIKQEIQQALILLLPDIALDTVAFACTAASAYIGNEPLSALIRAIKPTARVTNPMAAAKAGLTALNCRSTAILAPYTQEIAHNMQRSFAHQGLQIEHLSYLGIEDDRDIAQLDPDYVLEQAIKSTPRHCDSLFIPCTATPVLPVIKRLEQALNIPVLASNQAMIWHSLRLAGYSQPIKHYGQLLEKH